MKVVLLILRVLMGGVALVLTYAAVKGVLATVETSHWQDLEPWVALIWQSMIFSIPAMGIGLVIAAVWPRLWPLPLAALLWTIAATMLTEPARLDFFFNWVLSFGQAN